MKLMSLEVMKAKRSSKKNKHILVSKKIEYRLILELKDKLELYLAENDKVMLEINERVLGEFINILSDKLLSMYDYEQYEKNKFIFYTKEIEI